MASFESDFSMKKSSEVEGIGPTWLSLVQGQVESLRFGVVQIVVHDSRVVQIDRTEKLRVDQPEQRPSPNSVPTRNLEAKQPQY